MSRIAAWGVHQLLRQYELGSMAEKFNGDDDRWAVDVPKSATALIDDKMAAKVEFSEEYIAIFIPDIYQCIRSGHISEFDPMLYGIQVKNIPDFKGDTPDDIVAEIDIDPDMITGLNSPRRHVPKSPRRRKIRVKGSL